MLGITFSAEAEPSAAERISDCFQYFESRMDVIRLPRYCKVLDSIKIILFTVPDEKERKHISLKWREAEIRVRLDGDTFMKSAQDEQRDMVRTAITRALEIIRDRSEVKNFRFECKELLYDMFPDAYMTPFVFSTESESPAAQMIMDNFCLIEIQRIADNLLAPLHPFFLRCLHKRQERDTQPNIRIALLPADIFAIFAAIECA